MLQNQPERVIIIALQRNHLQSYLKYWLLLVIACALIIIAAIFSAVFLENTFLYREIDMMGILLEIIVIFLLLILFLILANGIWMIFLIMRRLMLQEPVLIVDEQGITICDLVSTHVLLWAEIAFLSMSVYRRTPSSAVVQYLGIHLQDRNYYLLRFHPLWRFLLRQTMRITGTPLGLPQWYLAEPIMEILTQIQQVFSSTLEAYSIQVEM